MKTMAALHLSHHPRRVSFNVGIHFVGLKLVARILLGIGLRAHVNGVVNAPFVTAANRYRAHVEPDAQDFDSRERTVEHLCPCAAFMGYLCILGQSQGRE